MSHPTAELSALLDGALAPARADEVRRHLAGCAACAAEERRLRDALALLCTLPPAPEPSPLFAARLLARLDSEAERATRAGWLSRTAALRWKLAVPAAGLAAAALATTISIREARGRERAMAEQLGLLDDYEAVASLGDVDSPEDTLVVAQLDELEARR